MKTAILLLGCVGVAPAIMLSTFLLSTSLRGGHISLSQRVHSTIFIQHYKLTLDTVLWWPLLVVLLGASFLFAFIFMLRSHS